MSTNPLSEHTKNRIAVLIPAFNPGEKLEQTLQSIRAQSIDAEIFVVDDGSSPAISLRENYEHIRVIRMEKNSGIVAALNVGLELITRLGFEYLARNDCGDVDLPGRLEEQSRFLDANPQVALVGSSVRFVDSSGRTRFNFEAKTNDHQIRKRMRYSAAFIHPACMFRVSALRDIGPYSDEYRHAEDYDLFFRILEKYAAANLPAKLLESEYAPLGISISNRRRSLLSRLSLQKRYIDKFNVHSYFGIARTLTMLVIPYSFVSTIKNMVSLDRRQEVQS